MVRVYYFVVLIASLMLVACGGGGASDGNNAMTPLSPATGVGYYVDAAVKGVNYRCGNEKGITDENGTFLFEKGKGCRFELGGIRLKDVPSNILANGVKIVEDNLTVARFLQSIDVDGDLSNGIQISSKVRQALLGILKKNRLNRVPKDDIELLTVVTEIENNVSDFNGTVKSKAEVIQHLEHTKIRITKGLLRGKTLYGVGFDRNSSNPILFRIRFDSSMTQVNAEVLSGVDRGKRYASGIKIRGKSVIFTDLNNTHLGILGLREGYLAATLFFGNGAQPFKMRLYRDKAKAEAYLNVLQGGSSGSVYSAAYLKNYFSNKTLYYIDKGKVHSVTFNHNASKVYFDNNDTKMMPVGFETNAIKVSQKERLVIDKIGSTIKAHDSNGEITLYLSRQDAKSALTEAANGNDGTLYALLANHTFYTKSKMTTYDINGTISGIRTMINALTFLPSGILNVSTMQDNNTTFDKIFHYTVVGDMLTVSGKNNTNKTVTAQLHYEYVDDIAIYFTAISDNNSTKSVKLYFNPSDAMATSTP